MEKKEILKLLQRNNKRFRLPKEIDFLIFDGTLSVMMSAKGIMENMQKNGSAFEGWAICLKAWIPGINNVIICCKEKEKIDAKNEHYQRFIYRLWKFTEIYDWATTKDFIDEIEQFKKLNLVVNSPLKEATKKAIHTEAIKEREYCDREKIHFDAMDHQLPVHLFKDKVSGQEGYSVTPSSFLDIWSIKGKTLYIYELKVETNKMVGIISELMYYVNVMSDIMQHKIIIQESTEFRSFDKLHKMYQDGTCNMINGIFLADKLHTLIENNKEVIMGIINDGKFNIKTKYEHQKVEL